MVSLALALVEDLLWQAGLYGAIRAIMHGISQNNHLLYVILEHYNPETCMFFTPVRKMGFAVYEMYEVSGLVMVDAPYEEYVPYTEELHLLKKDDPLVYETYWEVLCHLHICEQPNEGLGESGKWHGRAIFFMV